jgi:hypothetical protein
MADMEVPKAPDHSSRGRQLVWMLCLAFALVVVGLLFDWTSGKVKAQGPEPVRQPAPSPTITPITTPVITPSRVEAPAVPANDLTLALSCDSAGGGVVAVLVDSKEVSAVSVARGKGVEVSIDIPTRYTSGSNNGDAPHALSIQLQSPMTVRATLKDRLGSRTHWNKVVTTGAAPDVTSPVGTVNPVDD